MKKMLFFFFDVLYLIYLKGFLEVLLKAHHEMLLYLWIFFLPTPWRNTEAISRGVKETWSYKLIL